MKKFLVRLYLRLFNSTGYILLKCYERELAEYQKRKRWKERTSDIKEIIRKIEEKYPIFKKLV